MYLGRCVEMGTKEQIFKNPQHPYTQALLSLRQDYRLNYVVSGLN